MKNSDRIKKTSQNLRNLFPYVSLAFMIFNLFFLFACGGDGSSGETSAIYTTEKNNVTTIAGNAGKLGLSDGTGTDATFYNPFGITNVGTNLYVAEYGNSIIRKIY